MFLTSAVLCAAYAIAFSLYHVVRALTARDPTGWRWDTVGAVVVTGLAVLFVTPIAGLLAYHIRLMWSNRTTIELVSQPLRLVAPAFRLAPKKKKKERGALTRAFGTWAAPPRPATGFARRPDDRSPPPAGPRRRREPVEALEPVAEREGRSRSAEAALCSPVGAAARPDPVERVVERGRARGRRGAGSYRSLEGSRERDEARMIRWPGGGSDVGDFRPSVRLAHGATHPERV